MKKIILLVILSCILSSCNAVRDAVENVVTGDYVMGIVSGNSWSSEWLGLRFTAPSNFVMATQEELVEISQIGMEMSNLDAATINWAEVAVAFEMMAMTGDAMTSVSVLTERVLLRNLTIEQYLDASIQGFVEATGWQLDFNDDLGTMDFIGMEWHTATATVSIPGTGLEWTYRYIVRRFDNRMAFIQIYSLVGEENQIDLLINSFRAY